MNLVEAAKAAAEELRRLHPKSACLAPANCPTERVIQELNLAIGLAENHFPSESRSHAAVGGRYRGRCMGEEQPTGGNI